jgi:hypothetical protein
MRGTLVVGLDGLTSKNQDEVFVGLLLVYGVVFIGYGYYIVDYNYMPSSTAVFFGGAGLSTVCYLWKKPSQF